MATVVCVELAPLLASCTELALLHRRPKSSTLLGPGPLLQETSGPGQKQRARRDEAVGNRSVHGSFVVH